MDRKDRSVEESKGRPRPPPKTVVLVVEGPIGRPQLEALCRRARRRMEGSDADAVTCDLGALDQADAVAVEALARLRLAARRRGMAFDLRDASPRLKALISFMGLKDIIERP